MNLSNWRECPHLKRISSQVPGLSFRGFGDAADVNVMSELSHLSWKADGVEWFVSPDEIVAWLDDRSDHDHTQDLLFAEIEGKSVGYSEVDRSSAEADPKYYSHSVHLLPQWRGKGILEAMFSSNEDRIREAASSNPVVGRPYLKLWAYDGPSDWKTLVESSGYSPVFHLLEMAHTDLGSVRELEPPPGLDFGPVRPEEYGPIWALFRECFSHEAWTSPDLWTDDVYAEWLRSPNFTPGLWKVARSGKEIVGVVENHVNEDECARCGRKVSHSNRVCVKADWRRKGIASYLMTESLKGLRDIGIEEATLDTEVENKSLAMRMYEGVGFRTRRTFTFYAKAL